MFAPLPISDSTVFLDVVVKSVPNGPPGFRFSLPVEPTSSMLEISTTLMQHYENHLSPKYSQAYVIKGFYPASSDRRFLLTNTVDEVIKRSKSQIGPHIIATAGPVGKGKESSAMPEVTPKPPAVAINGVARQTASSKNAKDRSRKSIPVQTTIQSHLRARESVLHQTGKLKRPARIAQPESASAKRPRGDIFSVPDSSDVESAQNQSLHGHGVTPKRPRTDFGPPSQRARNEAASNTQYQLPSSQRLRTPSSSQNGFISEAPTTVQYQLPSSQIFQTPSNSQSGFISAVQTPQFVYSLTPAQVMAVSSAETTRTGMKWSKEEDAILLRDLEINGVSTLLDKLKPYFPGRTKDGIRKHRKRLRAQQMNPTSRLELGSGRSSSMAPPSSQIRHITSFRRPEIRPESPMVLIDKRASDNLTKGRSQHLLKVLASGTIHLKDNHEGSYMTPHSTPGIVGSVKLRQSTTSRSPMSKVNDITEPERVRQSSLDSIESPPHMDPCIEETDPALDEWPFDSQFFQDAQAAAETATVDDEIGVDDNIEVEQDQEIDDISDDDVVRSSKVLRSSKVFSSSPCSNAAINSVRPTGSSSITPDSLPLPKVPQTTEPVSPPAIANQSSSRSRDKCSAAVHRDRSLVRKEFRYGGSYTEECLPYYGHAADDYEETNAREKEHGRLLKDFKDGQPYMPYSLPHSTTGFRSSSGRGNRSFQADRSDASDKDSDDNNGDESHVSDCASVCSDETPEDLSLVGSESSSNHSEYSSDRGSIDDYLADQQLRTEAGLIHTSEGVLAEASLVIEIVESDHFEQEDEEVPREIPSESSSESTEEDREEGLQEISTEGVEESAETGSEDGSDHSDDDGEDEEPVTLTLRVDKISLPWRVVKQSSKAQLAFDKQIQEMSDKLSLGMAGLFH